jgi:CO/xanthine dehydrogenase Mo-binding subunit
VRRPATENFEYIEPKSLREAVAVFAKFKNEAKLLAGETDLIVNDDGSVNLATSCTEIGSGSSTALTQIASEVLGIEGEKINILFADTETRPMGLGFAGQPKHGDRGYGG